MEWPRLAHAFPLPGLSPRHHDDPPANTGMRRPRGSQLYDLNNASRSLHAPFRIRILPPREARPSQRKIIYRPERGDCRDEMERELRSLEPLLCPG